MPKTSEMRTSKFLQKSDVGNGVLLTVTTCTKQDVSMEEEPEEFKWTLSFKEVVKPLVLNSTNIQLCEKIFGSDDTDHWAGQRLVLFTDPNVSYGGRLIGGIRVRAPRLPQAVPATAAPAPPPRAEVAEYDDSDGAF